MNRITLSIALSLALVACKKDEKKDPATAAKAADEIAPPAPAKDSGPFPGWDMAGRAAAMQGAYVTPGDSLGTWQAWEVKGDKVTIWDGTAEKTLEIALLSPCEVKTTERSADGSSSATTSHYTIKDGAIWKGLGDAGSRRGSEAIACVFDAVFTVDAKGTCTEWEPSMFDDGKYQAKPGSCGWKTEGGKEVFFAVAAGHETFLEVHGDALLSQQLAQVHSEKVADFAAAKTARDSK